MCGKSSRLWRAAEKLASHHEIENRDFMAALNLACKGGKRRNAMGLFNVDKNIDQPIFFIPVILQENLHPLASARA
ncbi:hypothetical protein EYZ11_012207 [Aspergillus tanneri]|uniref:Uncharacterized protein n=1 Tax=Aspergillus tanneri TaxID=1220188 RepID=A0A4S3J2Y0_9EURO|nr:hypothetical protein EYZ11_012207 [Aspergillus tanneri]